MRALVLGIFALQILTIYFIHRDRRLIMEQLDELEAALTVILTELDKVSSDTDSLIAKLEAVNTDPAVDLTEVLGIANSIKDRITALDAKVEDAPAEEPAQ